MSLQPTDLSLPAGLDAAEPPSPSPSPPLPETVVKEPFSNLRDERDFEDAKHLASLPPASSNTTHIPGEQLQDNTEILADLPDETEDIELTHLRLSTLKGLGLERFSAVVERICLRQNQLTELWFSAAEANGDAVVANGHSEEVVDGRDESDGEEAAKEESTIAADTGADRVYPLNNLPKLTELDLYDNRLPTSALNSLSHLPSLTSLDLSFNNVRSLASLDPFKNEAGDEEMKFPKLENLYVIQNKVAKIEGVKARGSTLKYLELGGNRLRQIENLPSSSTLRSLFLGKNKITRIENLQGLTGLTTLSIQSNRITKIEGLEALTELEELYLSHNGITTLEGLSGNRKLTTLDISNNQIVTLAAAELLHTPLLEEFWANNNLITHIPELGADTHPELATIYLEGNPVQKELGGNYRGRIMGMMAQVKQIDAIFVRR